MKRLSLLASLALALVLAGCGGDSARGSSGSSGSAGSATGSSGGSTTGVVTSSSGGSTGSTSGGSNASTSSASSGSSGATATGSSSSGSTGSAASSGSSGSSSTSGGGSSSASSGSAGSSGSTGSGSSSGSSGSTGGCGAPSECPGVDGDCAHRTCVDGVCGMASAAFGTPTSDPVAGDCQKAVCDGSGGSTSVADDSDLPASNGQCQVGACSSGAPVSQPVGAGAPCNEGGGAVCDGSGQCVACNLGSDCTNGGACVAHACQAPSCSDGLQNQGEAGVDCGGPCGVCPMLVGVFTGAGGSQVGSYLFDGGWSTGAIGEASSDLPALTVTSAGLAVALVHGPNDSLDGLTWSNGSWSGPQPVGAGITTRAAPSLDSDGAAVQAIFHGTDFQHYALTYSAGWSSPTPVNSAGPTPATVAAFGADATIAFFKDSTNALTVEDRVGGTWQGAGTVAADTSFVSTPVVVRLGGGGPDALLVFIRQSDEQLLFLTRTAGSWSSAAQIPSAFAPESGSFGPDERVALVGWADGHGDLAFRGTDDHLYVCSYVGGAWTLPAQVATPVLLAAPPALARGVGGDQLEAAIVGADGFAYHLRRVAGTWTAAVAIAGPGLNGAALGSAP